MLKASGASLCIQHGVFRLVGACSEHMHPHERQPQGIDVMGEPSLNVGTLHITPAFIAKVLTALHSAYRDGS